MAFSKLWYHFKSVLWPATLIGKDKTVMQNIKKRLVFLSQSYTKQKKKNIMVSDGSSAALNVNF